MNGDYGKHTTPIAKDHPPSQDQVEAKPIMTGQATTMRREVDDLVQCNQELIRRVERLEQRVANHEEIGKAQHEVIAHLNGHLSRVRREVGT